MGKLARTTFPSRCAHPGTAPDQVLENAREDITLENRVKRARRHPRAREAYQDWCGSCDRPYVSTGWKIAERQHRRHADHHAITSESQRASGLKSACAWRAGWATAGADRRQDRARRARRA
jgi:hypothetical protein